MMRNSPSWDAMAGTAAGSQGICRGDEDMGAGIAQLLAQLHELMQDRLPHLVLVDLPEPLQRWLDTRTAQLQRLQPERRWTRAKLIRARLTASFKALT